MGKRAGARESILSVFRGMVLTRPYDDITVRDIVAEAGVARSTFYDHYPDKRAVLLASMEHLLKTLANCAAGRCNRAEIDLLVTHLWDNRSIGRRIFRSNAARPIVDALAASIQQQTDYSGLSSSAVAHGYIGALASWLSGEIGASRDEVVDWLARDLTRPGGVYLG